MPSLVSPDDQKVTFVELFFDLVFVYCVTQVVTLLHGHVDAKSAGAALLVFWLVWWAWTQFTWALNAANTEHPWVQLATLAATAVAFLLAVGIPRSLGDGALWFAGPYVAVRTLGLLVYHWVASPDPVQRRNVRVFGLWSTSGLVAVLAGAVLGGPILYMAWALAIVLDLVAATAGAGREGWNLHPDHFAERHGLIVIIALGETLIVAAAGLVAKPTPLAMTTGLLAVAVSCGLWWTYFCRVKETLEHAMAARTGRDRSQLARDVFSILHFPMLCGIVALAVGTEQALAHADEPLDLGARIALGGGAVLFVCGTAVTVWRATGRVMMWRSVLIPASAVGVALANAMPAATMAILLGALILVSVLEQNGAPATHRAHDPSSHGS